MKFILVALVLCANVVNAKFKINYISEVISMPVISAVQTQEFAYSSKNNDVEKTVPLPKNLMDNTINENDSQSLELEKDNIYDDEIQLTNDSNFDVQTPVIYSTKSSATLYSTLKSWVGNDVEVVFKDINWAKNIVLKSKYDFSSELSSSIAQLLGKLNSNKQMKANGIILSFSLNQNVLEISRV